jgi:hypothetical protein
MSRAIKKQLFSNVIRASAADDPIFDNGIRTALPQEELATSFFFISDYMYGGCLTFTAHLLHTLNRKEVFRIAKKGLKRERRTLVTESDIKMFHLNTWILCKISSSPICISTLNAWKS